MKRVKTLLLLLLALTICGCCVAEKAEESSISGELSVISDGLESKDVCRMVAKIATDSALTSDDIRLLVDGSEPLEPLTMEPQTGSEASVGGYICIYEMDFQEYADKPLSISLYYGDMPLDECVIHPPKLRMRTYSLLTAGFFLLSLLFLLLTLYCGRRYRRIRDAMIEPESGKSNLTLRGDRADQENMGSG